MDQIESMEYGLKTLLEFISSHNGFEENKQFYESLSELLEKKFHTGPLMVFSISKNHQIDKNKNILETCRTLWNRQEITKTYSNDLVQTILSKFCRDELAKESWGEYREKDRLFYSFHCGEVREQVVFGIFESEKELLPDVLDYLVKLTKTITDSIEKWLAMKKAEALIFIDDVTGLYNQRKLLKDLDHSIRRHREYNESFAVLFIDIDHFKQVNDGHGHLVGTQLLTDVANLLKKQLREYDLCYRYGGDEFVVIAPDATAEQGQLIGRRILKAVSKKDFKIELDSDKKENEVSLSVSIGVAGYPEDAKNRDDILSLADKMMYQAKKSGRGQVCHANVLFSKDD